MKKMKKLVLMLAMTLSMIFLTGCYSQNVGIQMKADGSGEMSFGIMVEKSIYNLMGSASEELSILISKGFVKGETVYNGDTYVTFTKSAAFTSSIDLQKLLTDGKTFSKRFLGSSSYDDENDMALLGSAIITNDTFQGVYSGSLTRFDLEEPDPFLENMFTLISITYEDEIQYSNGQVSEDKKTVTWTLKEEIHDTLLRASTVGESAFEADTTKPVISGVKNGAYYNDWVFFTVTDNVGIKSATINGKKLGHDEFVYNAAKYTITATDFDGNTTKVTFYVDYKAPTVSGVAHGTHYKAARTIKYADDRAVGSATLNGKAIKSGTVVSKAGTYTLKVTDKAGNTKTVKFVIDKTRPTVTGVADGKAYKTSKTIKFSDNGKIKSATLNGKAIKSGTVVSKAGTYTLKVTDKAGNTKTVKFVIDKTRPTVSGVADGKTYKTSKTIKFSDNDKIKSATLNGKAIKSGKVVTQTGSYTLKVTDRAGNVTTVQFKIKK